MGLESLLGNAGAAGASANPVGLGIAAGAGLLKAGLGFLQQAKGKKMLKKTVDPGYVIPGGYGKNVGQAEQLAKSGLSDIGTAGIMSGQGGGDGESNALSSALGWYGKNSGRRPQ